MPDSDMKRIGGLWLGEKNGRKFLSGKLDERVVIEAGCRLFVFPAKDRRTDKSPTHVLMAAPPQSQRGSRSSGQDDDRIPGF